MNETVELEQLGMRVLEQVELIKALHCSAVWLQ